MPTRNKNRRSRKNINGQGIAGDILKKLLLELTPLAGKLLEKPAEELGDFIGKKIKNLTGNGMIKGDGPGVAIPYYPEFDSNHPNFSKKSKTTPKGSSDDIVKKKKAGKLTHASAV